MKLTEDEQDVLTLMAKGATRNYAAVLLGTSPSGIARVLNNLYDRTGANTTIELVCFLHSQGLLPLTALDFPDCSLGEFNGATPYQRSEGRRTAALKLAASRRDEDPR